MCHVSLWHGFAADAAVDACPTSKKQLVGVVLMIPGVAATVVNDAVMTPADVVKQRLQVDRGRNRGVLNCAMRIWQEEGLVAFYRCLLTLLLPARRTGRKHAKKHLILLN